jgi:dipeptidase E
MKLILASKEKFLLEKGYDLLDISRQDLKIGFINTAFKISEDKEYIKYVNEYFELMELSGIDFKQFDIEGKTTEEILSFFSDRNVIQIGGGNVFYLLKAVRESGFDKILKKLLDDGINYISCSSGTYLMCPTVEIGGWKTTRNRYGITDFTALGYVPFLIKCHYTDDIEEKILEKKIELKYPLRILKDDQAFVVENGSYTFIGDEEEVKF